ncbi:gamma-glutamylcyclotransferase family protein [Eubacteriaceae bacterium ES3]|nr:gamma-glutamylcyclotransferase family protein [Eubacteriaceae bacterium ES3]
MQTSEVTVELLFSYGTLRDEYVQKKIFGKKIPSKSGKLSDYQVKMDADGFFNLVPGNQCVYGRVLQLTSEELLRADQWEEVPVYEREKIQVEMDGESVEAWFYERKRVREEKAVRKNDINSGLKKENLDELLEAFCKVRDLNLPAGDVILRFEARKLPPNKLKQLKKRLFGEVEEQQQNQLDYSYLGELSVNLKNYPLRHDVYWMGHDAFCGEVLVATGMTMVHPERIQEKLKNLLPEFLMDRDIELKEGFRGHLFTEKPLNKHRHYRIVVFPEWFEETYTNRFEKEMELIKIESEIESGA